MFGMLDYRAFQLYRLIFGIPNFVLGWVILISGVVLPYLLFLYFWQNPPLFEYPITLDFNTWFQYGLAEITQFSFEMPFLGEISFANIFSVSVGFLAYLLTAALLGILYYWIVSVFDLLFSIFVDVLPADGRTEEQAKTVLKTGKRGAHAILMEETSPEKWTDEMIDKTVYYSDWALRWFYKEELIKRLYEVSWYYFSEKGGLRDDWLYEHGEDSKRLERNLLVEYNGDEEWPMDKYGVQEPPSLEKHLEIGGFKASWGEKIFGSVAGRASLIQLLLAVCCILHFFTEIA